MVYPRKNQACLLIKGSKPDLKNVAIVSCQRLSWSAVDRTSSLTFCHWGTYAKHGATVPSLWTKSMDPFLDPVHGLPTWTTPSFLKMNFYQRSKRSLGTLNGRKLCQVILSGLKAPHIIHLFIFFRNSIHGFGSIWKEKQYFKIFEGDMRRAERQYSLTQLFLCSVTLHEDRHKNSWVGG